MGSSLREALLPSRAFRRQPPGVMGLWQLRSHRVGVNLENLLRLGEVERRFALDELGPGAGCGSDAPHGLLALGDWVALRQDGGDPDDGERGAGEKHTNHKRRLLR